MFEPCADTNRFVGDLLHVQAFTVGFGEDCDALDAELPASPNYAAGDFATVCDENLFEHQYFSWPG